MQQIFSSSSIVSQNLFLIVRVLITITHQYFISPYEFENFNFWENQMKSLSKKVDFRVCAVVYVWWNLLSKVLWTICIFLNFLNMSLYCSNVCVFKKCIIFVQLQHYEIRVIFKTSLQKSLYHSKSTWVYMGKVDVCPSVDSITFFSWKVIANADLISKMSKFGWMVPEIMP